MILVGFKSTVYIGPPVNDVNFLFDKDLNLKQIVYLEKKLEMHFSCSFAREKVRSVCQSYFTSRLNVTVLSISIQEIVKFYKDQNTIDFLNLAIEENLLVQAKEIYDNFVMRELLIRQRKRSDCSRKAEGPFDTFFGVFTLKPSCQTLDRDTKFIAAAE